MNLTEQMPHLRRRFVATFGGGDIRVMRAPARINILGEHVDYVSYLPTASLPFGSQQHGMLMLFRANDCGQIRGVSVNNEFTPFSFDVDEPGNVPAAENADEAWAKWLQAQGTPAPHWSNYVKGAVWYARMQHRKQIARGFDFLIDSSIPPKGGASSSSALVVLAGAAIRRINEVDFTAENLAFESSRAEWYVGTRGGALDHTAICLAEENCAVHLNYATSKATLVTLPNDHYCWVTFFSHEADKGKAVMLAYNERAAVARLLIPAVLHQNRISADASGDFLSAIPEALSLAQTEKFYPAAFAKCQQSFPALIAGRASQPLKLRDRARHHLSEAQRVTDAVKLLRETFSARQTSGNIEKTATAMLQSGHLINASHESLRDHYEVSTAEVEQLRDLILADQNVYGARLMGGGFGGNVLALTTTENASKLAAEIQQRYYAPQGRHAMREGAIMISTPGNGLSEIRW
jgi:galactokinase